MRRSRVLIAAPDPAVATALRAHVEGRGLEPVGPFADGAVALASALLRPADVYLLDVGLPGIDGIRLTRRLREHGLRGRVVAVAGRAARDLAAAAVAAGADACVGKPLDGAELDAALVA